MKHTKNRLFTFLQLLFLSLLALAILRAPERAGALAALALQLWFEKMIPSLFPFMILSGLIVRLDFGRLISAPVYPLLKPLYQINKTMCTTLLTGFLFGYPLGAKTTAEQYHLGQLTKPQAQYLLSFCNNIGPVYLFSFALPLLGSSKETADLPPKAVIAALFFAIPLLYGLALRHTVYNKTALLPAVQGGGTSPQTPNRSSSSSFLPALDASITSACAAITRLGGYMIFFIVCNLLLEQAASLAKTAAANTFLTKSAALAAPVLEITSGLSLSKDILSPALLMTLITFGGLSCFAQTYTCIRDTDLSFGNYCIHKLLQSIIAFCLYTLLFSAFSGKLLSLS